MEFRTLKADEIECRVNTINENGLTLLLHKTSRTDMNILDETVGAENWQRDHKECKGNLYCGIGIWDKDKSQWIWKWDCGVESAFGDKQKGEASDSFKRAGFNWGIGRELYSSPFISIPPSVATISAPALRVLIPSIPTGISPTLLSIHARRYSRKSRTTFISPS